MQNWVKYTLVALLAIVIIYFIKKMIDKNGSQSNSQSGNLFNNKGIQNGSGNINIQDIPTRGGPKGSRVPVCPTQNGVSGEWVPLFAGLGYCSYLKSAL